MSIKFICILYSKYSSFSKNFINIIETSSIDLASMFNIKLVCVDNENIRNTILKCKKIDIKSVPCVLIIYEDGVVEKYEDTYAFNWIDEIIKKYSPQIQTQSPPPQPPLQQQHVRQQKSHINRNMKNVENIDYEDVVDEDDYEVDYENNIEEVKPVKSKKIKQKQQPSKIKATPIEELESEEEEISEDIAVEVVHASVKKKNDLMSLAASMQQSREQLDEGSSSSKKNIRK
jgi:predicted metal-dependent peptidase